MEQQEVTEAIQRVRELRNDVPEYEENNPEAKELIAAYHTTLYHLVSHVQDLKGFGSYSEALEFVDEEIRRGN